MLVPERELVWSLTSSCKMKLMLTSTGNAHPDATLTLALDEMLIRASLPLGPTVVVMKIPHREMDVGQVQIDLRFVQRIKKGERNT